MFLTKKQQEFGSGRRLQRRINDFVHTQVTRIFITIECVQAASSLAQSLFKEKIILPYYNLYWPLCYSDSFLKLEQFSESFHSRGSSSTYTSPAGLLLWPCDQESTASLPQRRTIYFELSHCCKP